MSDHTHIPVVGIVGGIGSGKSALAQWFAARHPGVTTINGDEVGHEVLKGRAQRNAIRLRFGESVFDTEGEIDRKRLGHLVFGESAERQAARHDLERIVHPKIRENIQKRIAEAVEAGKEAVLLDAAVLFEAGWNDLCHAVVFVDVPREMRLERLQKHRNWDEAELTRRESSQMSLQLKRLRAQYVLDNRRTLDESGRQMENILNQIRNQISL